MSSTQPRIFTGGRPLRHGPGAIRSLPDLLDRDARHLLLTDPGLVAAGVAGHVAEILADADVAAVLHAGVRVDPTIDDVEAALTVARDTGCTAVIGLGGGSALDAAKGLAARLVSDVPLREYGDGLEVEATAPFFAVPTTAGTGSEATRVAVITDPDANEKMAVRGEALLPRAAILDPELMASLPASLAAACGADALTHAVEACVSRRATPVTDALALAAIGIIGETLPDFVADRTDTAAAEHMQVAANLAGQSFTHAGLGLVHSLGEPLGAFHHVSHGLACALFLPAVMDYNLDAARPGYERVARALGVSGAAAGVAKVREMFAEIGLPAGYVDAGIEYEPDDRMIAQVFPQQSTECNPRTPTVDEVAQLFASLAG